MRSATRGHLSGVYIVGTVRRLKGDIVPTKRAGRRVERSTRLCRPGSHKARLFARNKTKGGRPPKEVGHPSVRVDQMTPCATIASATLM